MTNTIRILSESKVNGKWNFHVCKLNKKLNWPPNSMIIYYVCEEKNFNLQKAMKSYKVLCDEINGLKIVVIDDIACEIYDSRRK